MCICQYAHIKTNNMKGKHELKDKINTHPSANKEYHLSLVSVFQLIFFLYVHVTSSFRLTRLVPTTL